MRGVSSLPGGISGVVGSSFYINLLPQWFTDHAYDQLFRQDELEDNILNVSKFVPGPRSLTGFSLAEQCERARASSTL